jgi:hypothetical protein
LPCGDHDGHGLLTLLDGQVQLTGQPAARASEAVVGRLGGDAAGRFLLQAPLFRVPAACWWAPHTVESTLLSQVISSFASAPAWSAVKIRCQVPSLWHRRNRSYARPHGPYSAHVGGRPAS